MSMNCFRQLEDRAHAHADEDVAFAVLARVGLEVSQDLAQLFGRGQRVQPLDECRGVELVSVDHELRAS